MTARERDATALYPVAGARRDIAKDQRAEPVDALGLHGPAATVDERQLGAGVGAGHVDLLGAAADGAGEALRPRPTAGTHVSAAIRIAVASALRTPLSLLCAASDRCTAGEHSAATPPA